MLTGVTFLLLVIIALLAIPITLTYQLTWRRAFQGSIKLQWLFGLLRLQLPLLQSKVEVLEADTPAPKKRKVTSSRQTSNAIAAIRQKSFRQPIIEFIRAVWQAIHKHKLRLRIRIGLGDPADTGQLWALVGPVSGVLATVRDASIEIEPEFFDAVFELDSSGQIRVIPLQLIYLTIRLLLSPSIWRGVSQMRKRN